ncbi:hypothetical protein F5Y02DRAFT_417604 [Annulohypoxylon stygium]|nr:hypothetical protein F5Y02DRAFT_417604 [Annulohypoxylon stygium]
MDSPSLSAIERGHEPMPDWYIPPVTRRWHPGHIKRREKMTARRWESILFTPSTLVRLFDEPYNDDMDSHLILVANDWIRVLQRLVNRELRSPDNQVDEYCDKHQFSRLYALVYRLHDRVYQYSRGVPQVRQTPEHHMTTYAGVPESDVAQARQVMAKMLQMGFGTWIEDIMNGGWLHAYPGAEYTNFAFNPISWVLSWNDHDDGLVNFHSMVLDMVFGGGGPTEDEIEENNETELSEPRSTYSWIQGVPDRLNEFLDDDIGQRRIEIPVQQPPPITPGMTLSIILVFSDDTGFVSTQNYQVPLNPLP